MTLKVLLDVAKHYWIAMVACILVCTGIGAVYGFTRPGTYKATATVASSVDTATLKGQADVEAAAYEDAKITASADTSAKTVRITGDSTDPQKAVDGANEIASRIAALARAMTDDVTVLEGSSAVTAAVSSSPAKEASYSKRTKIYIALGFGGGVFLALCMIVFVASRKAPICDELELEEMTHLPILGTLPVRKGVSLLAPNVLFTLDSIPDSICLVPANSAPVKDAAAILDSSLAKLAASQATDNGPRHGAQLTPQVIACDGLTESADAAFAAHEADATLLVVAEWYDSLRDVEHTLHELKIAKANTIGIVYVSE